MASGTIKDMGLILRNIETLSYTTTVSSGVTLRGSEVKRFGKVVMLSLYVDITSAKANNSVIITYNKNLPKPATQYATTTGVNLDGKWSMISLERNNLTQLLAWGTIPVGTYTYYQFSYLDAG